MILEVFMANLDVLSSIHGYPEYAVHLCDVRSIRIVAEGLMG